MDGLQKTQDKKNNQKRAGAHAPMNSQPEVGSSSKPVQTTQVIPHRSAEEFRPNSVERTKKATGSNIFVPLHVQDLSFRPKDNLQR